MNHFVDHHAGRIRNSCAITSNNTATHNGIRGGLRAAPNVSTNAARTRTSASVNIGPPCSFPPIRRARHAANPVEATRVDEDPRGRAVATILFADNVADFLDPRVEVSQPEARTRGRARDEPEHDERAPHAVTNDNRPP